MSDALKRITELAKLMRTQEVAVAAAELALANLKRDLLRTKREDLPELMRECELKNFTLTDGSEIELKDDVQCAITEQNKPLAHKWLVDHEYDGIIKTAVAMPFGRGEHETALEVAAKISQEYGRQAEVTETVHPQTLRAFVRERLEAGEKIPTDLFSIFPFTEAKVKPPKTK